MDYMKRKGEIVKHWQNGKIEVIKPTPNEVKNNREDTEPFEDDGAYADD